MNFCLLLFIGLCTIFDITYGLTLKEKCIAKADANFASRVDDLTNTSKLDMDDCDEKFKVRDDDPQELERCKTKAKLTLEMWKNSAKRTARHAKAACSTCKKADEDKEKCEEDATEEYIQEENECKIYNGEFTSDFYYCRDDAFRKMQEVNDECQATYDSDKNKCIDPTCKKAKEEKAKCLQDAFQKSTEEAAKCTSAYAWHYQHCSNVGTKIYQKEQDECNETYEHNACHDV